MAMSDKKSPNNCSHIGIVRRFPMMQHSARNRPVYAGIAFRKFFPEFHTGIYQYILLLFNFLYF
jgi:hypothetical protein